ncbi:hypothetical protein [Streptococcus pantholopis]|uniref:Uncharacterized protein n=1 Tax=Streptococcus pantholopis TaxID=1811193 RepID=A0A172Q8C3_9STRE|nr:hypothetical protein [Streptococcus pantholopis]AND79714.1 hypothetical protein A0O21_06585 [Streptococcus pantholopis]
MLGIIVIIMVFLSLVRIVSLIFLARAMKPDTEHMLSKEKGESASNQEHLQAEEEREFDSFF